jgi:16S rRNA (cytidine1402-2'-O)-methyltransferase
MTGTLYVVATPIGNLEDISLRALRVLREADIVACEDTRRTLKLLSHYEISKPLVSYHEHNERMRAAELMEGLKAGKKIALVSDAGMPLLSDPGSRIVEAAIAAGIAVVPVPGASAITASLVASGLPADPFYFAGFLPSRAAARRKRLRELAGIEATLILFEAPHRIRAALQDAGELLGARPAAAGRELTKIHEEFIRGRISEVARRIAASPRTRGEFTLVIAPPEAGTVEKTGAAGTVLHEVEAIVTAEGIDRMEAIKRVARRLGVSKSEVYRELVRERSRNRVS